MAKQPGKREYPADERFVPQQKRSQAVLKLFLDALRETGSKTKSARVCGVSYPTLQEWKRKSAANPEDTKFHVILNDPEWDELGLGERSVPFFEAWAEAEDAACEQLEDTARMLALGYDEPVIYQGRMSFRTKPVEVEEDPLTGDLIVKQRLEFDNDGNAIPLTVRTHSETMIKFLLESYRSNRFGRKLQIDANITPQAMGITGNELTPHQFLQKYGVPKPETTGSDGSST